MKTNIKFPQKIKNRSTIPSKHFCFRAYTQRKGKQEPNLVSAPHVYHSISHSGQDMETTWMPVSGWEDGKGVVNIHNGISFSPKKGENPAICHNMTDLEHNILSEISQRKRSTYIWYHLHVEPKNIKLPKHRVKWYLPKDGVGGIRLMVFKSTNLQISSSK